MKALKRAKVAARPRRALQEVLPLDTPFSIYITPSSLCNIRCNFCYHSDEKAKKEAGVEFGTMSLELFKKIIDDICEFPQQVKKLKVGTIGEPLINKELAKMIAYAKEKNAVESIDLYTNGTLLNEKTNMELINAGVDWVNISVNGIDAKDFENTCGRKLDMEQYVANIKHFYDNKSENTTLYIKLGDKGYTEEQKQKFYDIFGDICDEIFIEAIVDDMWEDTNVKKNNINSSIYGGEVKYKEICPLIFNAFAINYDGKAVACCLDWKEDFVLGDFNTQSALEIWNGKSLRAIRMKHLLKHRKDVPLCKECVGLMAISPDNIDDYSEELLKKYDTKKIN